MLSKPAKTRLRALRDCGVLRAKADFAGFEELAKRGLITWKWSKPLPGVSEVENDWLDIRLNASGFEYAAWTLR